MTETNDTARKDYRAAMFCSENFCDCCSLEKCKENKCADGKIICRKKAKAALERAHEIRKFEIDLLWKRTTYMSTFQAFLFAALGVSFSADNPELAVYFLRVIVCVVGMFSALFWFLMNKGSKFWYGNWENHIDFLEYEFEGNLHKTVLNRDGKTPFSVSRINISTSFMFFGTWCVLATLFLLDFIWRLCLLQCFWAQYSHAFYLSIIAVVFVICLCRCCGLHTQFRGVDNRACGTEENKVFLVEQNLPTELKTSSLDEVGVWAKICQIPARLKCKIQRCKSCRQQTDGGR